MSSSKPNANKPRSQGAGGVNVPENIVAVACRVPEETRRQFHAACVYRGKTMNEVLISYIMKCIKVTKSSTLSLLLATLVASADAQISPLFEGMGGDNQSQMQPLPDPGAPTSPAPDMATPDQGMGSPDNLSFGMDQNMGTLDSAPVDMSTPMQPDSLSPVPSEPAMIPPPFPQPVSEPVVPPSPALPVMQPPAPVPQPAPIIAKPVQAITPTEPQTVKVDVEKLELGKISRTISQSELKKMDYELVATEKTKPINLVLGDQQVKLEVPIIGYLIKERKVTPSPLAVPVASVDAGYRFSDTDMRNLKIMYNTMLEKANVNATTAERFREVLKSMEDFIRGLDVRKQASNDM